MNNWEEEATLTGMLERGSVAHHAPLVKSRTKALRAAPAAVRAVAGIGVPPILAGPIRGFLAALFIIVVEVIGTHFGIFAPGTWQAYAPTFAASCFVLFAALDQWAKPGQNTGA